MVIAQEGIEHMAVGFQAIGPPVIAHLATCLFHMRHQPRQHGHLRCGLIQALVYPPLRFGKGLVQRHRDPAVLLVHLAPDHHRMHDGEDAGLAEIGALDLDIVLEQTLDAIRRAGERRGRACALQGIDLAGGQHLRQCLVRADVVHAKVRRQCQLEFFLPARCFFAASVVIDAIGLDAVLVGQNAAYPNRCGHLVLRHAHAFADQVFRLADTGLLRHENAGVPEKTRREHRDRHKRLGIAKARHGVGRQRHLGHIEFAVAQLAEKGFLHRQVEEIQVDALGLDAAVHQGMHPVVVPARECEAKF